MKTCSMCHDCKYSFDCPVEDGADVVVDGEDIIKCHYFKDKDDE
jgi:hypothetical protein